MARLSFTRFKARLINAVQVQVCSQTKPMNLFKNYCTCPSFQQIVRYHMDHNDYDSIIETCKRYRSEPYLWVQALTYFAQREEDCKSQLIQVLDQIDEKNLVPPLLVSSS